MILGYSLDSAIIDHVLSPSTYVIGNFSAIPDPTISYSFDGTDNAFMTFTPSLQTVPGVIGLAADLDNGLDYATLGILSH